MDVGTIRDGVAGVLRSHGEVLSAYLYGSFARGTSSKNSDIDIGLLLAEEYQPGPLYESRISLKFDKSLGRDVEARILNNKPLPYLHQVLKYGKNLYSTNEKARINFETRTYSNYLDIKPYYEEYDKIRKKRLLA